MKWCKNLSNQFLVEWFRRASSIMTAMFYFYLLLAFGFVSHAIHTLVVLEQWFQPSMTVLLVVLVGVAVAWMNAAFLTELRGRVAKKGLSRAELDLMLKDWSFSYALGLKKSPKC